MLPVMAHLNRIGFAALGVFGLAIMGTSRGPEALLGAALIAVAVRLYPRYRPASR